MDPCVVPEANMSIMSIRASNFVKDRPSLPGQSGFSAIFRQSLMYPSRNIGPVFRFTPASLMRPDSENPLFQNRVLDYQILFRFIRVTPSSMPDVLLVRISIWSAAAARGMANPPCWLFANP